jgi:hypothetical protein
MLKGTLKIKLDPLKTVSKISDSFTFKLESKRFEPKLDVTIALRNPISGKEYTTVSKTVLTITKTFPPFRGEGAVESHNYPGSDKKVDLSEKDMTQSIKPVKKPESNVNKTQQEATKNKASEDKPKQQQSTDLKPNKPKIDPSIFSQVELDDPDNIDNINTIKVMEFKIEKLQNQINQIEGRAPPKLREKLIKIKCKKNIFEPQLGETISIQDYIILMKTQIEKDRKLALYFEQEKMIDKAKIVAERIPIIIKELEEAMEFAKSSKK